MHRPDVICTPHLGASTTEAQEGVALEVVEAVVDALAGNLSVNAVNAPMVGRAGRGLGGGGGVGEGKWVGVGWGCRYQPKLNQNQAKTSGALA